MLRNLNELEKNIFKRSMLILFNTESGSLVVDDELVASRAKDVECKAFSSRKTGKDGPVADCAADSITCMLLGTRLNFMTPLIDFILISHHFLSSYFRCKT